VARWLLAVLLLLGCSDSDGRYLHVTVTGLPAGPLSLEATVTVGGQSASQAIDDVEPVDGETSFVIRLPDDEPSHQGSLEVEVRVVEDSCTTWRGTASASAADEIVRVTVPVSVVSPAECGEPATSCITDLSASHRHACAARDDGELRCWGFNDAGQLGYDAPMCPTSADQCSFTAGVVGGTLPTMREVAVGVDHTCAIALDDSSLWCWGGSQTTFFAPTQERCTAGVPCRLDDQRPYEQVGSGEGFSCALSGGRVWCLGSNRDDVLGVRFESNKEWCVPEEQNCNPFEIAGVDGVVRLVVGRRHACAVKSDASLWCWGSDQYAQLGTASASDNCCDETCEDGTPHTCTDKPVQVTVPVEWSDVAIGDHHGCVLSRGDPDQVLCWGNNDHGQLGAGVAADASPVPTVVPDLPAALSALFLGQGSSCVRDADGAVSCWGDRTAGKLADGSTTSGPEIRASMYAGGLAVEIGERASCAATASGVSCTGDNVHGMLARPYDDTPASTTAIDVGALSCP
jgi:alpha-tubulin suppressor-like RCC1 family protein